MKSGVGLAVQKYDETIQCALLILLASSIPLHRNLSIILVVLYAVHGLFQGRFTTQGIQKIAPFLLYFLVLVFGCLYSNNLETAAFVLTKQLFVLVIPLVFLWNRPIPFQWVRWGLIGFTAVSGLLFVFAFVLSWEAYRNTNEYRFLFYHDLAAQAGLSALYFSMFLVLGILVLIKELFKPGIPLTRVFVLYALIFVYVLFVIALASRASILALFAVFILSSFWFSRKQGIVSFRLLFFSSILLLGLATYQIPLLNERFKEAINYENKFTLEKAGGGTSFRFAKWESAIKVIQSNFWLGCGTGDVQAELNKQYLLDDHPQIIGYNAHNQYLQSFTGQGIAGILTYLLCLIQVFRRPFRSFYGVGFGLLFAICTLTESMLEAQKGILFFSYFASVFLLVKPEEDLPQSSAQESADV